jgi:hypothetical protein
MPSLVACPACGADGTAAAEDAIARSQASPVIAASPAAPVPAGTATLVTQPTMRAPARMHSQPGRASLPPPDRAKAEAEARLKIFWGDPREEVVKFAMMQGLPRDEALALVAALVKERVAMLRGIGIRRITVGISLVCVPFIAYLIFQRIGVLPLKLFALTVMAGLYGAYLLLTGLLMVFFPKSEQGDIADK